MSQILLLTKNTLNEQSFEKRLRQLGHEVFTSTTMIDACLFETPNSDMIKAFQHVILSETIANAEVKELVKKMTEYPLSILRKSDESLEEAQLAEWKDQGICSEVFENKKPQITVEMIEKKEIYIQSKYLDKYVKKQLDIKNLLEKNEKYSLIHKEKSIKYVSVLEALLNCNTSALKKYQNAFVKKIRIPLYIFSGRIIQNYQLGLGVDVEVNDTQVYFKVADKDTDIFNILSMGQLNGVVLSLLLAIRKVYSKENQLELILIDDPLQSIDELSAHSFADILAEEFSDTQLVLSTHEDDKSRLIQYKYKQLGKRTKNYNMQLEYLKS
ncbi:MULTISPECIES: hypothetical protein [Enterococcus]|uniref:hypothetical protein n=1 Tax=Enterococcus TaxID=1350 RepID=UPI000EC3BBBB|nr:MULTISPECIES: hypothetical protein [Enterococcus]HCM84843.1 hypothetical protein [Enterococcus sp.]